MKKNQKVENCLVKLPIYVFIFSLLVVFFGFLLFYLIDLRNVFGLRDHLFDVGRQYFFFSHQPFFFHHWGRNSGPAEIFQWLFLAFSSVTSAFITGYIFNKYKHLRVFWGIMTFAFLFMLLEDAGNLRHTLMSYVQLIAGEADQGFWGTGFEALYFGVLGGLPLYALIKYWKDLGEYIRVRKFLLVGFVFYFLAGSLSFLGSAFEGLLDKNLYTIAGEKFYTFCLRIGDSGLVERWEVWQAERSFDIGFFLLDSLVEEALELIGGGGFLAACLVFLSIILLKKQKN